jgi:hypothetical protein
MSQNRGYTPSSAAEAAVTLTLACLSRRQKIENKLASLCKQMIGMIGLGDIVRQDDFYK